MRQPIVGPQLGPLALGLIAFIGLCLVGEVIIKLIGTLL